MEQLLTVRASWLKSLRNCVVFTDGNGPFTGAAATIRINIIWQRPNRNWIRASKVKAMMSWSPSSNGAFDMGIAYSYFAIVTSLQDISPRIRWRRNSPSRWSVNGLCLACVLPTTRSIHRKNDLTSARSSIYKYPHPTQDLKQPQDYCLWNSICKGSKAWFHWKS